MSESLTIPQCISRCGCMRPEECRRQGICMRPAVGVEATGGDFDPTPWCNAGHPTEASCDCGPIDRHD